MFGRKGVKRVESIETEEAEAVETEGFSLEELGSAYANAIEQASGELSSRSDFAPNSDALNNSDLSAPIDMLTAPGVNETDGVQVTSEAIIEAILFLGTSNNRPIPVDKLLELLRGITVGEIDEAIDSLNSLYQAHNRAMTIVRKSAGYSLQLVPELHLVRDRFYGKIKETQLTQSAIDCLSLVAYQPGATREELEEQWNQPATSMLSTLVRKGLLRIEKRPSQNGPGDKSHYFTTDRFLEIIGLESLGDLPHSEDI